MAYLQVNRADSLRCKVDRVKATGYAFLTGTFYSTDKLQTILQPYSIYFRSKFFKVSCSHIMNVDEIGVTYDPGLIQILAEKGKLAST